MNCPTWPDRKQFALVLTHDVDSARGLSRCRALMQLEMQAGFRSVFNFVPEERYLVPVDLRRELQASGFEVGVHGLTHDGRLFESEHTFNERAARINSYLSEWGAAGFRAPAMHHNLEWISRLNIAHDMSTFDTDVFEPQPDGVGTIFPFVYAGGGGRYVELPYTLPQDFTLFVLMREPSIDIWVRKLDWVAENGGMALVNSHPDYMRFDGARPGYDEYPARRYQELLEHVRKYHDGRFWHALPCEVAAHVSRATVTQTCLHAPEAFAPESAMGGA
jgi:hypothetical protein